jgi:iron complex outermembrane recepter protein
MKSIHRVETVCVRSLATSLAAIATCLAGTAVFAQDGGAPSQASTATSSPATMADAASAPSAAGAVAPPDRAPSPPSGPSESAGQAGDSGDIMVTARRRSERLSDVPAAVTAFTAKDLQSLGVTQPADFLSVTPGVFYRTNTTPGTSFINIRGVTQSRNAESPVGIVVDGVFLNNPYAFQNQLVDIEQIEVLKGPQGALYGRNASAGAIIITTPMPTNDYHGFLDGAYGRHSTYKFDAVFSGPIIKDKLLFRLTAWQHGTDGFLKNQFLSTPGNPVYADRQRDFGVRGRLIWKATDDFTADLRYEHSRTKGGYNNDFNNPYPTAAPWVIDKVPFEPNVFGLAIRTTDDASLKLDWTTDAGVLTSVSAYSNLREREGGDGFPYSSSPADGTQSYVTNYKTYSQELRWTSPGNRRFRYILGGYFQHTDRFFSSSSGTDTGAGLLIIDPTGTRSGPDSANPATGGIYATKVNQNAFAVFGSAAYDILPKVELSAAVRYDRDHETGTNVGPFAAGFTPNLLYGAKRTVIFDKIQPKVTLKYKLPNGNIYATYAQGFKNGGFNPQGARAAALLVDPGTAIQDEFGAETTTTYELGYKGEFLNRKLAFNLAGYFNRIKGANYFDFVLAAAAQVILNIDRVDVYGLEASVTARPTDTLTLTGSVSTEHGEIKKFRVQPETVGNVAPFFPNIQAQASINWQKHIGPDIQAFAHIDDNYNGRIYWDTFNNIRRPPLNLFDARIGLIYDDEKPLRVELFCRNCTNEKYINEEIYLSGLKAGVAFPVNNAREIGFEISKRF